MRILHVNKFLYRRGGAEAYAEDLAQLQHAAGHDVTFFGMRHPDNDTYQYERSFPTQVDFAPAPRSPVGRVRGLGRMMWSTSAARGMDEVLAGFRPDVVHLHSVHHELSATVLRPLARRGVPAVMTLHDYQLACPTTQLLDHGKPCTACVTGGPMQAVRRRCNGSVVDTTTAALEVSLHRLAGTYDPVRRFLCPSWFLADVMKSAGVYPDRMHLQEGFVDIDVIAPAHLPGEGAVFFGQLTKEKGVDVLINAWRELPGTAHLHIAGDGPERASLERLAETTAPGRVTFHGNLDQAKVHDLVRSAAVVVLPSLRHENQPLAALEAFACGRPVVATRLGGMPEIVQPEIDGDLVPAGDPDALAESVRGFLAHPERAAEMGEAARAKAEKRYAPTAHAAAIERHYRAVTADGRDQADTGEDRPANHEPRSPWPHRPRSNRDHAAI